MFVVVVLDAVVVVVVPVAVVVVKISLKLAFISTVDTSLEPLHYPPQGC